MILAVDLASKFSAAILRDRGGQVLGQFDSRNRSPFSFAAEIGRTAREAELTLVEGLPYGIDRQAMILPPARFQGVVMLACHRSLEDFRFIDPARWMNHFPGVGPRHYAKSGLTKTQVQKAREEAMAGHAKALGYEPPDLIAEYAATLPAGKKILKKDTNPLAKNMTDYVAAFLISEFARVHTKEELFALQGVDFPII